MILLKKILIICLLISCSFSLCSCDTLLLYIIDAGIKQYEKEVYVTLESLNKYWELEISGTELYFSANPVLDEGTRYLVVELSKEEEVALLEKYDFSDTNEYDFEIRTILDDIKESELHEFNYEYDFNFDENYLVMAVVKNAYSRGDDFPKHTEEDDYEDTLLMLYSDVLIVAYSPETNLLYFFIDHS